MRSSDSLLSRADALRAEFGPLGFTVVVQLQRDWERFVAALRFDA